MKNKIYAKSRKTKDRLNKIRFIYYFTTFYLSFGLKLELLVQ